MRERLIRKTAAELQVTPNLPGQDTLRAAFSWDRLRDELGAPADDFNIARLAVDRHATGPKAHRVALRFLRTDGSSHALSYAELSRQTNRFANALRGLGVGSGARVFVMAGRIAQLYVAVLGSLKNGSVVTPLFSAFGPEPIATRIGIAQAQVLVTTEALYRRKVEKIRERLPSLQHVIVVGDGRGPDRRPGTLDYDDWMAAASESDPPVRTAAEDLALLHFTSGTTGTPKGAMHVHAAALTHFATGRFALDLHDDDVFWCTADPGWVTGTSYGIVAPLLHGVTSIVDEAEFDAERWYRILQEQEVSVWYTAPTAIRMLMKAGPELARKYAFPKLRFIASVGEPLNPEAVWWGKEVLGLPIHDNNAVYLTYLEECRDRWVRRTLGDDVGFVIVRVAIDFRRELSLEDGWVTVACEGTGYGTSSIRTAETIRAKAGWIAAESESVIVAHDAASRKSRPITDRERSALDAAIEADRARVSPEGSAGRT